MAIAINGNGTITGITAGGLPNASIVEADIADNAITGGKLNISLVAGDTMYASATDTLARLAKGTNGQVLKMGASIPAWGADNDTTIDLTADQSWTGAQRSTMFADNDGSFDLNERNNFKCVAAGAITLTFTNITGSDGQSGYILLTNAGHAISKAGTTKTDANMLATLSAGTGTFILSYISNNTNVYLTNSAIME